ncbi:unnamed protein product, partial [marine sediment metagenome]
MANGEDADRKSYASTIGGLVLALGLGGGGVGILAGSADTASDLTDIRTDIEEIRASQSDEEARIMALINAAVAESAERSRRVRDEIQSEIDAVEDKLHAMELEGRIQA